MRSRSRKEEEDRKKLSAHQLDVLIIAAISDNISS